MDMEKLDSILEKIFDGIGVAFCLLAGLATILLVVTQLYLYMWRK